MSRRDHLQKLILRRLLFYGRATRPELVALTRCRAATVFEAIDALKSSGMVVEPERRGKKTGRRAPELECDRDFAAFLGIELKPDGIIGVVTDSCGDVTESCEERFAVPNADAARAGIDRCVTELRRRIGDKWELVKGIGFADPGTVDIDRKVAVRATTIPGWEDFAVGEWLAERCGVPAGVWPGRMVKVRMEYVSRLAEAPESLFLLDTGSVVGGGFIKGGKLFVGASGQAMEIGHLVIDPNGGVCSCGNRGCLETLISRQGILNSVRRALDDGVATELAAEDFSIRRFVECAHRDKAARLIAGEISEHIGSALAAAVALLNPAMIVVSGELAGLGSQLTDAIRRTLEKNCFADAVHKLKIELSTLDVEDTARGAAMMMRDRIFGIEEQ